MWSKLKSGAEFSYDVLIAAANEYGVDRVSRMSAAVAYRTIFALAPVLIISVGIFGAFVGSSVEAQERIIEEIANIASPEVAEALGTFIASAVDFGDFATVVGVVLLLWTTSSLFFEVQNDLNDIFHVPYGRTSGVVETTKKRGIGFLWAVGIGLMMLALWLVNFLWQHLDSLFVNMGLEALHQALAFLTPLLSLFLLPFLFALLYQSLTAVKIRRRALLYGSGFTSIGFIAAAWGAGLYFAWEEGASALTIAGSFFVLLLMAYILSGVFLFGAVVMKIHHDYLEAGDVMAPTERDVEANAYRPEVVVGEPVDGVPTAAIIGFLSGLFVGWRRSRR